MGGPIVLSWAFRIRQAIRDATVWIAVFLVLLAGYSYRTELNFISNHLIAELSPTRAQVQGEVVVLRRTIDGHFYVDAQIEGKLVRFMIDTGATLVAISKSDAKRLGYRFDRLRFDLPIKTANGSVLAARVKIAKLQVGPIEVRDVRAAINGGSMHSSLLGMSFLDRLSSYEFRDDRLIFRP